MLLTALASAAIAAAHSPPRTERTPNLYRLPAACPDERRNIVDRYGRPAAVRLGDLPKPIALLAVERRIDGCPVITISRVLPPAVDDPNPPAGGDRLGPAR
jgi:hypothetical protein